ncbi:ran BP2/NZF zinc finger-like superfamily protein isoform X2 [Wolffia australiana]
MSQVDGRHSSTAGKRARTDGARREDDWICPSCNNVNFSFRTTCNMRNCTQPRPADHNFKIGAKPLQPTPPYTSSGYMGSMTPSMYLGAPPYATLLNGSAMPPYDIPGSGYHYDYGSRLPIGSPYGALHMSGPPPYSPGGMYGMAPLMNRYGMGMPMGPGAMIPRMALYPDEGSQKKSADRESDWTCPSCGNTNFGFRTACNMRKCNAPRPGSQTSTKQETAKPSKPKMPEGSWKCDKCNNINYPFRTKCNRQNCGAERPANESAVVATEDDVE